MSKACLFSILISVLEGKHLLFSTLDTLKNQIEKDFEVILLGEKDPEKLHSRYEGMNISTCVATGGTSVDLLNEGIRMAQGTYLQFFHPGDRFICHQGLSHVRELIETNQNPHLAYARMGESEFTPLSRNVLQNAAQTPGISASWFLKQTVVDLGGFNQKLAHRAGFDLLCRLFLKEDARVVYSPRVLTDSSSHESSSKETIRHTVEICQILYRHFGLWPATKWLVTQDLREMALLGLRTIRQAFRHHPE